MNDYISVYITAASLDEAKTIADKLVTDSLAACVNIMPEVTSVYRWLSKVETSNEVALIAKTRQQLFPQIEQAVKTLSSYDCPCIVAWPIVAGSDDYLNWISKELSRGQ